METSEFIFISRLAEFKQLIKHIHANTKLHKSALKQCERSISIDILNPLLHTNKSIGYWHLDRLNQDRIDNLRSNVRNTYTPTLTPAFTKMYTTRELHFAYSLMRGRKPNEIENKVAIGNEINMAHVNSIITITMGIVGLFAGDKNTHIIDNNALDNFRDTWNLCTDEWRRRKCETDLIRLTQSRDGIKPTHPAQLDVFNLI